PHRRPEGFAPRAATRGQGRAGKILRGHRRAGSQDVEVPRLARTGTGEKAGPALRKDFQEKELGCELTAHPPTRECPLAYRPLSSSTSWPRGSCALATMTPAVGEKINPLLSGAKELCHRQCVQPMQKG